MDGLQRTVGNRAVRRSLGIDVSMPGDAHEVQADRVANQVMRAPIGGRVGGRRGAARSGVGGGQPLDGSTRSFFEQRFGEDFGDVRVHAGPEAAESARELSARAYTIGPDVVFGAGEYQPSSEGGRRLIAHELAHVVQQSGFAQPLVQRACLPDAECATPAGAPRAASAKDFGQQVGTTVKPDRDRKRTETAAVAQASGHGRRAVEIEKLFASELKELRPLIHAVVVDDTLPANVGGEIVPCEAWAKEALPPDADQTPFQGATLPCIGVPPDLEAEALKIRTDNQGQTTAEQRTQRAEFIKFDILRILAHEVTHQRVAGATISFPGTDGCTKDALQKEVSELAAVISEYPFVSDLPPDDAATGYDFHKRWEEGRLKDPRLETTPTESIPGSIRDIRCSCQCADADSLIRQAFDIASAFWSEKKKNEFHVYMKRGGGAKYGIYWPYEGLRLGVVGPNEISLTGGFSFGGADRLSMAMLTYRRVITSWSEGQLRLTAGLQGNVARLWEKQGEYGAVLGGLSFVEKPRSFEKIWGGFTGRAEVGGGYGDFLLKPVETGAGATTGSADLILQVGAGIQFYLPRALDMTPLSLEAGLRWAQPLDTDAKNVKTLSLSIVAPW